MKIVLLVIIITAYGVAQQRIIALSPAINEIVYAVGAGESIVANTEYCLYPKASMSIPKVGGYFSVSLEKIVVHKPNLVIMQKNNDKLALKLKKLNIKTEVIQIDSLKHIKEAIGRIGILVHREEKAQQIIIDINKALSELNDIVRYKKILIVIGHNTSLAKRIFVAGKNLYFEDIIQASGNHNAFQSKRAGQPILNMENIIATNPDIVILLAHSKEKYRLKDINLIKPWKKLPIRAAKTNSIYIIDKHYAGIPSDRLIYFLRDFKEILNDYKQHVTIKQGLR